MKIRLMCLPSEVTNAVEVIRSVFNVTEVSEPRPNRGDSRLVRVYVETQPLRTARTGFAAEAALKHKAAKETGP